MSAPADHAVRVTDGRGHALAPLGRRAGAWVLDAGLGVALAAIFVSATGGNGDLRTLWHLMAFKSINGPAGRQLSAALHPTSTDLAALGPLVRLLAILSVITLAGVAYRVITTAKWGAGLGKALLGLQVVVDGPHGSALEVPGWSRSWKRWAVPQAPGLIPLPATGLLAYVPAVRDPRRRGLHDRAAGTVVIDIR
jgi:hypothetical protein